MILVTGATGLVGQHLLENLTNEGKRVRALYRTTIPTLYTQVNLSLVEWVQGDILDFTSLDVAFEHITHVYHCAAMVSYDSRKKDEMMLVNVEGTANVVNLCLSYDIEKLVYVSSISTMGDAAEGELITEKTEIDENAVHSNYAISKQKAEMEVWRGIAEGLTAVIVNPAIILGEGDWDKSSTNLFKIVYNEFKYFTKGATGWVDVKDVVKVMTLLMDSSISAERFILCAQNLSYKEVFTMMANAMNKKPPSILASPWITEVVWRLSYIKSWITGTQATLTKETARSAHNIKKYDHSKLLALLNHFSYMSIESTIQRVAKTRIIFN
jgi:nucleoside-diphosphate-sugar epimerase